MRAPGNIPFTGRVHLDTRLDDVDCGAHVRRFESSEGQLRTRSVEHCSDGTTDGTGYKVVEELARLGLDAR